MSEHLVIVGNRRADRERRWAQEGPHTAVGRCHRRLRGPYTGVDEVLAALLGEAAAEHPDLVEQHRVELLYGMPELAEIIGPAPSTLAADSPFTERTRFFGSGMIRCMSQGVVTFLLRLAEHRPMSLVFEDLHEAEPTTRELVTILVRRADPARLRVVVSGAELSVDGLRTVRAEPSESTVDDRSSAELVAAYIASDGTSEDPAELAAYRAADPALVAAQHDRRADELEPGSSWGTKVGAITYHRERGTDPGGAGREALARALQFCVEVGFSAAIADLGMRGRAVTDPVAQQRVYCEFTCQAAAALVPLGDLEGSLRLYEDLRHRYPLPRVHMTTSYAIAMLYTRFFTPRDHEKALEWQNNALAIASLLPDERERLVFTGFQNNALALIEMHRGNLGRALELINTGIDRLDRELDPDQWVLHRSQLLYNRARLLLATGRLDEAYADYTTLVGLDPYYTDYLSERAKVSRKRGDFAAALADYDHAVRLAPPFPELYYNRATARIEVGDTGGALADLDYVLEMEPDEVDTRITRADLLLGLDRVDEAEADVLAGLALLPGEPRLLCMAGTIALERGEPERALRALDAALAADPDYPAALVNRAAVHFDAGRLEHAVEDLTRTLEQVGADPDVLFNRGVALRASGQVELALRDFDAALELPGADEAELRGQRAACLADQRLRSGHSTVSS
ncbi:hypothetical protein GCM10010174_91260 [Kutzneria viridogrisea]|uniref:Uncharacterized protein n=2 Tax=Kutzneria TaxID=43356 RepID=W5VZC5_9PSEU|nr:tetratricopeptide repeat protein [Kutzneria albida]AHH93820.1 hypothetical protein KALB_443 [Kutzneria albida DSM 43870]MBA8931175.1 tetratricopeptide (TPR) repeat protein [Kutzneria viridogrisea]